jgi:hypothetical protein
MKKFLYSIFKMQEDKELEMEQLDYMRRNAQEFNIVDDTIKYPDALKEPLERPVVLTPLQEKKIIEEIKRNIPSTHVESTRRRTFSINSYFDILSSSFVGIMEDLLNFDGNLENFQSILTKEDRTVFIGTILIIISILVMVNKN